MMNEDNLLVQTAHARLKKSWITGKYLTVGHNGATTRAYITQLDKDLDEEVDDSSTNNKNNEDPQDDDSPTEDNLPSEDNEEPKTIHHKTDEETVGDPFNEDFDTWVINTSSQSKPDAESNMQAFLTACDMEIIPIEASDEENQQDF